MAEIDDLYSALEKADATGNAGDAREIAGMIRQMEAGSAKPAPAAAPSAPAASSEGGGVGDMATAALAHAGDVHVQAIGEVERHGETSNCA